MNVYSWYDSLTVCLPYPNNMPCKDDAQQTAPGSFHASRLNHPGSCHAPAIYTGILMLFILLAVPAVLGAAFADSHRSLAYSFEDHMQGHGTPAIQYAGQEPHFVLPNDGMTFAYYLSPEQSQWHDDVETAFEMWSAINQGMTFTKVTEPSLNAIRFEFYEPGEMACGGGGAAGCWDGTAIRADTGYSDLPFFTHIIMHEFGHVLGLGHTRDPSHLMHGSWHAYEVFFDDMGYNIPESWDYTYHYYTDDTLKSKTSLRSDGTLAVEFLYYPDGAMKSKKYWYGITLGLGFESLYNPDGTQISQKSWWYGGHIETEMLAFPDGTLESSKSWYEDGSIWFESLYNPDGTLKSVKIWDGDGRQDKHQTYSYTDGTLQSLATWYENGLQSHNIVYGPDGIKKSEQAWYESGQISHDITYYPDGNTKQSSILWHENGQQSGQRSFYPDGAWKSLRLWSQDGIPTLEESWHENGQAKREMDFYKDGTPANLAEYDQSGTTILQKAWWPNGHLKSEHIYHDDGNKKSTSMWYYEGMPESEESWHENGSRKTWTMWGIDGKTTFMACYDVDESHIPCADDHITLNVFAFNDDGDGVRQTGEIPFAGLAILVYVPSTGMADLLFTGADGTASKADLPPYPFYVITLPPEGMVASNHPLVLESTTYHGVLHVKNPAAGSSHNMNVGIIPDPCTLIPSGNIAAVILGCLRV